MKEIDFESYLQKKIHLYVFDNVDNPKGIVQIAHGMQEYMKTYFNFANYLNKHGYIVVGMDERAHGKTAKSKDELGQYDGDLFGDIVLDQIFLSQQIKAKTNLPLILFGHSFGSFITQKYVQECDVWDKVILSGSSYMKTPLIKIARVIALLGKTFKGRNKTAKLVENMSFKSYQKHFKTGSWITRNEKETKAFYDDELNGTPFCYGFYHNMFSNQLRLYDKKKLENINKKKPILLISGDQDPVGEFSKGITKLYSVYQGLGLNVRFKLFPQCRHGLVQEINKEEVFDFILKFIDS